MKMLAFMAVIALAGCATPRVVFVCEHGAAKSVVAAAHFNDLAAKRGLRVRAIARGVEPQAQLAPSAVNGLRGEGLTPPIDAPAKLTAEEARRATRVVAFCELPPELAAGARVERWDAPAVGDGYAPA